MIYKCSLERAFKTPMLCDISKVHNGYVIMPKITHSTVDENWGVPGSSKKLNAAKSFTQKGGFASADKVIGITVRTTNTNGQSALDIGQLWGKLMSEGMAEKIPNKVDDCVFSIYTNYKGDYTQPYDTLLGCAVNSLEKIPNRMVGQSFDGGIYSQFVSKGDLTKGLVFDTWSEIWKQDLDRAYAADFELYGPKTQNPTDAEVEICRY